MINAFQVADGYYIDFAFEYIDLWHYYDEIKSCFDYVEVKYKSDLSLRGPR